MAGDWRLYLEVLAEPGARVAYEATPLNVHRRHAESVTHALRVGRHIAEIESVQAFATQVFELPEKTQQAQDIYLSEVTEQLKKQRPSDMELGQEALSTKQGRVFRVGSRMP